MIRPALRSDLDAIMRVEQAAHSHPWAASIMQRYLEKPDTCWVCEEAGVIQAHSVVSAIAGEAELLTIAVHPDMQGRGLGSKMLNQVIAQAQRHQAEQIFLEVRESNHVGIALYEKAGFCELGRRTNYYPVFDESGKSSGREDALLLGLPL
ncbi:MAG: ribosomal protein S18-alanine N-acetyltransferase [Saccharospirillaceae bacterium]|nr:ribosomal protein S18-alanine N-acetyltransferase [Saccharospirillaceae bacterium]